MAAAAHQQRTEPDERQPLLSRRVTFGPNDDAADDEPPIFSCVANPHSHLPVYTNIHRIRRDIVAIVEDYLTLEQLRDVRLNMSVVRPLVDKLYELNDISIVYCLLVNRAQFLNEQAHSHNRQNVNFARATLCELVAIRILRRFNEDNPGPQGLLVLAHVLIAGFEPFQNAPEEIRQEAHASDSFHNTLPALEVAIISESKMFLSSSSCLKVVNAIYEGRIIYTPSSFLDIIPDRYKQKPISLYDPREASLLNQYRLIVPRTRNLLEIIQFIVLIGLYLAFMAERNPNKVSVLEVCFAVYGFGWVLDQFATMLEHGWNVYTQNLWSFLDVTFTAIYWIYLILRIHGLNVGSVAYSQQAMDVLAMGAPVLIPRLAFNLLSDNLLFVSLRSMMADFTLLTVLAAWCFFGFLLSLIWLGEGRLAALTISKWMIYIWFGLDGTGIHRSTEFHWLLGPCLMIAFAFLGNTLFLTILVSMLSNTFSTIVSNATAEIQFRHAVLTLEGVKSDAIFAYQPPFNILALLILVPLKFFVSPRWFHKIHVASVRLINLPLLLIIAVYERRLLWPKNASLTDPSPSPLPSASSAAARKRPGRFWERWRITVHSDIAAVFELSPPDSVTDEIAADDELTHHMIRRQFAPRRTAFEGPAQGGGGSGNGSGGATGGGVSTPSSSLSHAVAPQLQQESSLGPTTKATVTPRAPSQSKPPSRRDSMTPFPGLRAELRSLMNESDEVSDLTARLEALEDSTARIEAMLAKLTGEVGDVASVLDGADAEALDQQAT